MVAMTTSGAPHEFSTTHWTEIQAARTSSPEHRRNVLENLARRYWKPVYHYLRARGHQDAEARDITQDFFMDVVLGRDLFGKANPARGRFRAYLLHCLKNYLRDRHRRGHARDRAPSGLILSIDRWADGESTGYEPSAVQATPEAVFHHRWAVALLEQVLERLITACKESGLTVHLEIFRHRVVRPALEQIAPIPLEDLARRYGLTVKQAANRSETVRRRFRRLLSEEVRLTVMDESSTKEELRALMGQLRRRVV